MRGNEAEYDDLFRTEFPAVMRTAYLILGDADEARDVAQEAFVQLYVHWGKVSGYDSPRLWLRRVAIRAAVKAATKRRKRRSLEAEPADVGVEMPERDEGLRAAIAALPPAQRSAVVLHYFEDRPVVEVAQILGIAEGTAKVHLHRARQSLARALGEEVPDVR